MRQVSGHGGKRPISPASSAAMMSTRVARRLRGLRVSRCAERARRSWKKRATSAAIAAAVSGACDCAKPGPRALAGARRNTGLAGRSLLRMTNATNDNRNWMFPRQHRPAKVVACQRQNAQPVRPRCLRTLQSYPSCSRMSCVPFFNRSSSNFAARPACERKDHGLDRTDRGRRHRQRAEAERDERQRLDAAARPSRRTASAARLCFSAALTSVFSARSGAGDSAS